MRVSAILFALACFVMQSAFAAAPASALKTRNVILVMSDGVRWQEVFQGADPSLINKAQGVRNEVELRQAFLRSESSLRQEALMPFVHNVIGKKGQLIGNQSNGSVMRVSSGLNFSYPGYSEALCGLVDSVIQSNDKVNNRNVTVLEWLHRKSEFKGQVAAFGTWDVFPYIFNRDRGQFHMIAGFEPVGPGTDPEERALNERIRSTPRTFDDVLLDQFHYEASMQYPKKRKPRVLFIGYGETDEWAHARRYDQYLSALHKVDQYLQQLWETLQSMPEYKDQTTLLFTTDHGRGNRPSNWNEHGESTDGAQNIWMGILGPDTPAMGERSKHGVFQQAQIAATLAACLGHDFTAFIPRRIAERIPGVIKP